METINQIKIDEGGCSNEIYLCPAGKMTWLYGRNISDRPISFLEWARLEDMLKDGKTMKNWANALFKDEISLLHDQLQRYGVKFLNLPGEVQAIILNMAYNMGTTSFNPKKWPNFFKAIAARDWKQAAIEGRDSRWFHQVGRRSERLMNSLENVEEA